MMIKAIALAAASWEDSLRSETRQSAYAAAMATAARAVLSVSSSSLISIAEGRWGAMVRRENKLSMMKSSIRGKQYLAYLWELGELPAYIISGFGVLWESEVRWSVHGKNSGDLQDVWVPKFP